MGAEFFTEREMLGASTLMLALGIVVPFYMMALFGINFVSIKSGDRAEPRAIQFMRS
jgi:hypothetical protein